jgi:hypothetical protein
MSRISTGLIGTVAALLAFDAVNIEIASGNDRLPHLPLLAAITAAPAPSHDVNRTGKSDRLNVTAPSGDTARNTVVFEVTGLPAMSIATHMAATPASNASPGSTASQMRNEPALSTARHPVACEGVVSVLTDVARQLAPGRCVT